MAPNIIAPVSAPAPTAPAAAPRINRIEIITKLLSSFLSLHF
jgi:hypothetical protein